MSQYFPRLYECSAGNVKFEFGSIYVTEADLS